LINAANYCQCVQKIEQKQPELAAEVRERGLEPNLHIFGKILFVTDAYKNSAKAGIHTDLPVLDFDKNMQVSHLSKATAKVTVLGIVVSNRKSVPSFV
jgi:hypothetical protein